MVFVVLRKAASDLSSAANHFGSSRSHPLSCSRRTNVDGVIDAAPATAATTRRMAVNHRSSAPVAARAPAVNSSESPGRNGRAKRDVLRKVMESHGFTVEPE